MKKKTKLLKHHRRERLKYAENVMSWSDKRKQIIFSYQKKFNLDVRDGYKQYWHDLRKNRKNASDDKWEDDHYWFGDPVFMMDGTNYSKLESAQYQAVLYDLLIPFGPLLGIANLIFQQDNASCHTSKPT
ncbi:hypothetical protein AVEN_258551-1 [Araneus ventricosus]|uniref:Tc1-like transposase DDE domain-containing protein n=1 Tax=Araneus ventricosus TaxID=182803 RepID=A0A4Y2SKA8_ARAVE|nr:hypothetical protein AVEN_258551-1 [Araneus ventricosus]